MVAKPSEPAPAATAALEPAPARAVEAQYGSDPQTCGEYGRDVSERHFVFDRLTGLPG